MSVTTTERHAALPTQRSATSLTHTAATRADVRSTAATAAIRASLEGAGCILVGTEPSDTGCSIAFYDIRSLNRAVEVIATAATASGDAGLAGRARQHGPAAWSVTAVQQQWLGPEGDPSAAQSRSATSWFLGVPRADLVPVAAALLH